MLCVIRETTRVGRPRLRPRVSLSIYLSIWENIPERRLGISSMRTDNQPRRAPSMGPEDHRRLSWHARAALHPLRGRPGRQASRCASLPRRCGEHRPTQASPAPPPSSAATGSLAAAAAAKAKGVAELRRGETAEAAATFTRAAELASAALAEPSSGSDGVSREALRLQAAAELNLSLCRSRVPRGRA